MCKTLINIFPLCSQVATLPDKDFPQTLGINHWFKMIRYLGDYYDLASTAKPTQRLSVSKNEVQISGDDTDALHVKDEMVCFHQQIHFVFIFIFTLLRLL